jgi:predicted flap endonuclease-1-like 5' DNA nuclease
MPDIKSISGIGPAFASRLSQIGIKTTEGLLANGATAKERKSIADQTDISQSLILRWVNQADLFRVKGIGEQYADLLEVAGVDTAVELGKRQPANLHEKMVEVNVKRNLVNRVPSLAEVESWVAQAKGLRRVITH